MSLRYQNLIVSRENSIGIIQLNRPRVLNALNYELTAEVIRALEELDSDSTISVIVITGGEKVFAAGADLNEISRTTTVDLIVSRRFELWDRIRKISKPIVAAVSGFCLGGGNELAMNCDMIVASETAVFGQPEVNVGIMPGLGGTQRLTRTVGKARAMEMILTGQSISAGEAYRIGLVNKVVPVESLMEETKKIAQEIAAKPRISIRAAKQAILKATDTTLEIGVDYERSLFNSLFATEDAREGMRAFLEKRKPAFKGK
ncbi:MAG: enoyl-CoA hydratase-related protein [Candidatus Bathyarchaeia archaeon]|jgi:enoyl-CoA hydratase